MKVMQSFRATSSTTNPYLTQLAASLPPEVETIAFSWDRAIFGNSDVIHLHWPENLIRGRRGLRSIVRLLLFGALMTKIGTSRTALVRTLHNETAHERGNSIERWLLRWCDRNTDLWIRLNPFTVTPASGEVVTIPHGHYRRWFARYPASPSIEGRMLSFGLIRPYKGVESLLSEFSRLTDPGATLRVVGKPVSEVLASSIRRQAAVDPRVGLALGFASDSDLAREISEAELVVLPYKAMHNSGALLLALSLERPVLVPQNDVTVALQTEVGEGWINTFVGQLDVEDLRKAGRRSSSRQNVSPPDLSLREWDRIGIQHADAYRSAFAHSHKR